MPERPADTPVRIIGSRELHQNLPAILRELERPDTRYVLTVHGKPRAVLIGAEPFLRLLEDPEGSASDGVVGLQLTALLGGRLDAATVERLERTLDAEASGNGKAG